MSLTLTRKTDYALVALSALARHKLTGGEPMSARQLSESFNLPQHLLMNVLKDLHRSGMLESRRGASGGYYLERDPEHISLKEIIECLEGPVNVTLCSDSAEEEQDDACSTSCQIATLCPISNPMQQLNDLFRDFLSGISLKSLLSKQHVSGLPTLGVSV